MHKIYLFQPNYSYKINGKDSYWIPYSAGCLWSYALQNEKISKNFELKNIFFLREPYKKIINNVEKPKICGFSTYIWNKNYNLSVAKKIKKIYPECIIVFGGPEVNENFLKNNFIDTIVLGEGEENFTQILNDILENKKIEAIYSKKRLLNLDIPSPYVMGIFDKIMEKYPDALWSATIETNRGCPYSCTFCDWGSLTFSKIHKFSIDRLKEEFHWISNKNVDYIWVADANFGIFKERDIEIAKNLALIFKNSKVQTINCQFAKNSNETIFEIAQILGNYCRGITLSVQSMDENVLLEIKRKNLKINEMEKILKLSEIFDIPTYTEVILGLPNETLESYKHGLCQLLELGQHNSIEQYFAILLANSELSSEDNLKKFKIKSTKTKNFLVFANEEKKTISEYYEIVNSTSTMSVEDFVEAYLFGWVIIQFHIVGYTQLYAKFLRNKHLVSYETFYNKLHEQIKTNKNTKDFYNNFKNLLTNFLKNGSLPENQSISGHNLHFYTYEYFYNNKELIFDIGEDILKNYTDSTKSIKLLQENFIFNEKSSYPLVLNNLNLNIEGWDNKDTSYVIDNKIKNYKTKNFYTLRRQGAFKNKIYIQ